MSRLTKAQLHYMQHALGLDDHGQGSWYRNHFVSGPDCDGWEALCELVDLGLMRRHEPCALFGGDSSFCFVVTEEGKRHVRENSPPPPKLTRAAERYCEGGGVVMDVTLARLRGWLPEWEWRAERSGFGWEYVGVRLWAEVRVRAYSVLSGPTEDDCETQWRAEEGSESCPLGVWLMRHMSPTSPASKGAGL